MIERGYFIQAPPAEFTLKWAPIQTFKYRVADVKLIKISDSYEIINIILKKITRIDKNRLG